MFPAEKFHLGIHPGGQLVALPVIAGFVGADTVACLLAVNLEEEKKMTLMIDIGTNGEIVLGNEKRLLHVLLRQGRLLRELRLPVECGAQMERSNMHIWWMENWNVR